MSDNSNEEVRNKLMSSNINLSDIEDIYQQGTDVASAANNIMEKSIDHGGAAFDRYVRPGSFLYPDDTNEYFSSLLSESFRLMGAGPMENMHQNFLSRLDRHGTAYAPTNTLNTGFTFITRPRLNLTGANLVQNPILNTLLSANSKSVIFMIRALMDTRLCKGEPMFRGKSSKNLTPTNEETEFAAAVNASPLIDNRNPFFTPLCNALKSISGFPDITLEAETTEGDIFSGDMTYAKGSDLLNHSQELSLEFKDIDGSIILTIFYYWILYIGLQCRGLVMAYPDDIYEQRLNYTVSIYRFIMDPSKTRILWWAKATGCFPKAAPVGALFNMSSDSSVIEAARSVSIPFGVNKVEVNNPGIILDFNRLMSNYCPGIESMPALDEYRTSPDVSVNFAGLPFITSDAENGLRLTWRTDASYLESAGISLLDTEIGPSNLEKFDELRTKVRDRQLESMKNALDLIESMFKEDETKTTDETYLDPEKYGTGVYF